MLPLKRSLLNRKILINALKALASIISICSLHIDNPPIEDYTEIFYMTSASELLYDCQFNANQFILATSPLILMTSNFFSQRNICGHSPYVTFSLM
jgi:hypothetical protein